jgi:hypothetical protein
MPQARAAAIRSPAPKGHFNLTTHLYAPNGEALTGKWSPPPIMNVEEPVALPDETRSNGHMSELGHEQTSRHARVMSVLFLMAVTSPNMGTAACPLICATAEPRLAQKASARMVLRFPVGMCPEFS